MTKTVGAKAYLGSVRLGQYDLQFRVLVAVADSFWTESSLESSDVVFEILARRYAPVVEIIGGGC